MNEEREILISDYGIYIMSIDSLVSFLKRNKIRSKKILSLFQKDHDLYINSLKEGVWIPIVPIISGKYVINGEFSDRDWLQVYKYDNFNLDITDSGYWVGSFGNLLNLNPREFLDCKTNNIPYKYIDCFKATRFEKDSGKYLVSITGYKRRDTSNCSEAKFGYSLSFQKVEEFSFYNDPREDDTYTFGMSE